MIISRTPFRISLFGGGTDYHAWYQQHGSAVLSTTINHYCYLTCRYLPPFFEHKHRIVWSKIEQPFDDEIEHPSVNAILQYLNIHSGVEIHHQGDLPARSGLGSSSSFTVGLLNALYAMLGISSSKRHLACEAVHIELEVLKENVGVQDQIATAFGGFNKISIHRDGNFDVEPVILPRARLQELHSHFLLFFTGVSRNASEIAGDKIKNIANRQHELSQMRDMVDEGFRILNQNSSITDFGRLLHDAWQLKQKLSAHIAPTFVQDIYEQALQAGALGGKLLGAGGGGFMLFFAKPGDHPRILDALSHLLWIPFEFENSGSQIVYQDNRIYSHTAMSRRDFIHLKGRTITRTPDIDLNELNQKRKSRLTV
jgi:D-glycero-alpha-D-manno-heptose-7-phosphate kinase